MAQSHDKLSNCPSRPSTDPPSFTFKGRPNQSHSNNSQPSSSLHHSNRNHYSSLGASSQTVKSNKSSTHKSQKKRALRSRSSHHSNPGSANKIKNSNSSASQPQEKPQHSKGVSSQPDQTRHSTHHRVGASSSVNFIYLDEKEQLERYRNKLKEYQALKEKLTHLEKQNQDQVKRERKRNELTITKERQSFKSARKKLHAHHQFELEDSRHLIENLAGLLAHNKLEPLSIEFMLLAAIVRRVKQNKRLGKKVSLGKREKRFLEVASKEGLIEFFSGIRVTEDRQLRGAVLGESYSGKESGWSVSRRLQALSDGVDSGNMKNLEKGEKGLTAEMLEQFDQDHPLVSRWQRAGK